MNLGSLGVSDVVARVLCGGIALAILLGGVAQDAQAVAISQVFFPIEDEPASEVRATASGVVIVGASSHGLLKIYPSGTLAPIPRSKGLSRGVVVGPDGNLWGLGAATLPVPGGDTEFETIVDLTPAGEVMQARFTEPASISLGQHMAVGADGAIWLTGGNDGLYRAVPGGEVQRVGLPSSLAQWPWEIVAGPDGALWFTAEDEIVRVTVAGGITPFAAPPRSAPYGLTVGADGAIWFAMHGAASIGRITSGGQMEAFPIGVANADPRYLASAGDGVLWFSDPGTDSIGRMDLSGHVTEYPIPKLAKKQYFQPYESVGPERISVGPEGQVFFTENNVRGVGRLDPNGTQSPVPLHKVPVLVKKKAKKTGGCRSSNRKPKRVCAKRRKR